MSLVDVTVRTKSVRRVLEKVCISVQRVQRAPSRDDQPASVSGTALYVHNILSSVSYRMLIVNLLAWQSHYFVGKQCDDRLVEI